MPHTDVLRLVVDTFSYTSLLYRCLAVVFCTYWSKYLMGEFFHVASFKGSRRTGPAGQSFFCNDEVWSVRVKGVNSRAFSGVCSLYRAISKFYLQKYLVDVQLFVLCASSSAQQFYILFVPASNWLCTLIPAASIVLKYLMGEFFHVASFNLSVCIFLSQQQAEH